MPKHRARGQRLLCLAGFIVALAVPSAGQADDEKPSGTIQIQQYQVAFIGSGSLGGGTLEPPLDELGDRRPDRPADLQQEHPRRGGADLNAEQQQHNAREQSRTGQRPLLRPTDPSAHTHKYAPRRPPARCARSTATGAPQSGSVYSDSMCRQPAWKRAPG